MANETTTAQRNDPITIVALASLTLVELTDPDAVAKVYKPASIVTVPAWEAEKLIKGGYALLDVPGQVVTYVPGGAPAGTKFAGQSLVIERVEQPVLPPPPPEAPAGDGKDKSGSQGGDKR